MTRTVDWLVIGGGIHGVHVAVRLLGEAGVARDRVRIVDPAATLLARWRECTRTTGMTHLRSPVVHHLDIHPFSLRRFAAKRVREEPWILAAPYDQPALDLFDAHCRRVVESFGLDGLHVRGRAEACSVDRDGVSVRLCGGRRVDARHVVLAVGASDQPEWPDWAPRGHPAVHHVFEPGFDGWPRPDRREVAVVGGGISAAQVALRLEREGRRVHLVTRHALREHRFDSDPGWLGPKFMARFGRERDLDRRRAMIEAARHRGSMPPEVRRSLRGAVDRGGVVRHEAAVRGVDVGDEALRVRLSTGAEVRVDHLLLATGFSPERPGGAWVDELIRAAGLPCARCGYPVVDSALRWHRRVHVTGPLAELELGPTSRNIAGAREAGERIVRGLRSAS